MLLLISEVRKKKGITQQELADRTGIHQQMISRFETGQSIPRIDQIILIINALGSKWDEVVRM